jgi:DNA polymerase-1
MLRLYEVQPQLAVGQAFSVECLPDCSLCRLSVNRVRVVMPEGDPCGVLFVGERPGREDERVGHPFQGRIGKYLRDQIARCWKGPVALDNAIRCYAEEADEASIQACRGHLAQDVHDYMPTRIIALGGEGWYALTGRRRAPFSIRHGYTWLHTPHGLVPVFSVIHPSAAARNRFVRGWFERDLAWALSYDPPEPTVWEGTARVVRTPEDAHVALGQCTAAEWTSVDVETSGIMFNPDFRVISAALCPKGSEDAWVWDRDSLADRALLKLLTAWLQNPRVKKVGQNIKFDALAARCGQGVTVRGIVGDTRLWRKLLDPEADAKLEVMAELVGMGGMKDEALAYLPRTPPKKQARGQTALLDGMDARASDPRYAYGFVPRDILSRYNARDAVATDKLATMLGGMLAKQPDLQRTWETLVRPASEALTQVEWWGVSVNRLGIAAIEEMLRMKLEGVLARLNSYGINLDSSPQVARLLFNDLDLPAVLTTETGKPSTSKEALEAIRDEHPVVGDILSYRQLTKLRGTYAAGKEGERGGLEQHIRADGRIHPTYLLDGARSGRLSCEKPNLQNIPRADSEEGRMIRNTFVASDGYVLVEFDYSQLEIRVAAALSRDPLMMKIYQEGGDYHQRTAEMVSHTAWGIKPEEVTSVHRTRAKSINFGGMYGKTPRTFAKEWGISLAEAERVFNAIVGRFLRYQAWSRECLAFARQHGVIWTRLNGERGRRRPMWRIADEDDGARVTAEHGAFNTPIQGTASDLCLSSLVACVNWLREDAMPAKLVLTVHDSLLFEVRVDCLAELIYQVRRIMSGWSWLGVPLVVDVKTGPAWGSLAKWKEAA